MSNAVVTTNTGKKSPGPTPKWRFVQLGIVIALLVVLGVVGWQLGLGESLTSPAAYERFESLVDRNLLLACIIYIAGTALGCSLLALPGLIFALIAGVLFGPRWGTLLCTISCTLGACIAFWIGRRFQKTLEPYLRKSKTLDRWLFAGDDRRAIVTLMVTRLVPVFPFNLQSYAYGVTGIRFSTYTWATFLFLIPGTALYTFMAAGVIDTADRWWYLGAALGLIVVLTIVGVVLKNRFIGSNPESIDTSAVTGEGVGKTTADPIAVARRQCTHCGRCRKHCVFLTKYDFVIGDLELLDVHREGCFLCGRCTEVCPFGVDGLAVVREMRARAASAGRITRLSILRRAGAYPLEKLHYPFKNYRHARRVSFFPGCSLFSSFPKTTQAVAEWLARTHDVGTIYDCCGSPIAELGLTRSADHVIESLQRRLNRHGVEELLVACPHCLMALGAALPQKVTPVYEYLADLVPSRTEDSWDAGLCAMGKGSVPTATRIYLPCPDRNKRVMLASLEPLLSSDWVEETAVQCCGYGGSAARHEPELAATLARSIGNSESGPPLVYCASCANSLGRQGFTEAPHVLSVLAGIEESADVTHSFINRVKTKFL